MCPVAFSGEGVHAIVVLSRGETATEGVLFNVHGEQISVSPGNNSTRRLFCNPLRRREYEFLVEATQVKRPLISLRRRQTFEHFVSVAVWRPHLLTSRARSWR